jgi:hypothetical protein
MAVASETAAAGWSDCKDYGTGVGNFISEQRNVEVGRPYPAPGITEGVRIHSDARRKSVAFKRAACKIAVEIHAVGGRRCDAERPIDEMLQVIKIGRGKSNRLSGPSHVWRQGSWDRSRRYLEVVVR